MSDPPPRRPPGPPPGDRPAGPRRPISGLPPLPINPAGPPVVPPPGPRGPVPPDEGWPPAPDPWRRRTGWIIALCFLLPPLGLYLLWRRSALGDGWRLAITAATGAVWSILIALVVSGGYHGTPTSRTSRTPAPVITPAPSDLTTETPPPTEPPTPARTATPRPTPSPSPTAPPPSPSATPAPTCGAPPNPYGYTFCGGQLIGSPPADFCNYFNCAGGFDSGTGYVVLCPDTTYTRTGGQTDVCAAHGGRQVRPLYSP